MGALFIDLKKLLTQLTMLFCSLKLNPFNFNKQLIEWFTSFLKQREQCVKKSRIQNQCL